MNPDRLGTMFRMNFEKKKDAKKSPPQKKQRSHGAAFFSFLDLLDLILLLFLLLCRVYFHSSILKSY